MKAEQIKKDILACATAILNEFQSHYPQFKEWDKKEAEKWLYRNRYNEKVVDDEIPFLVFEYPGGRYKIPNKYYALADFVKKMKAMPTHTRPLDVKAKQPSLKAKGVSLEKLQAEAWIDFENLYSSYRQELNIEQCMRLLNDIKEEMPELYHKIKEREESHKQNIQESYLWYFEQLSTRTPELNEWEKTIKAVDKREITLKSLSDYFRGVPSYKDVQEKVNRLRVSVGNYCDAINRAKKEMSLFFPDLYNELIERSQAA
jgi:uncharacterized protein YeeX (DUF496 family)